MITVIAHYRVRAEAVGDVRRLLSRHSRSSEAESGCRHVLAHQYAEDPTRLALYEVYDGVEAFEAHPISRHFTDNIERNLVPLLVERDWRVYGPGL